MSYIKILFPLSILLALLILSGCATMNIDPQASLEVEDPSDFEIEKKEAAKNFA